MVAGPRAQRERLMRAGTLVLALLVALTGVNGVTVTADPPPQPPTPPPPLSDGAPSLGNYTRGQELHDLTPYHAQRLPFGLRVWAPLHTETLRIDPTYLERELGAWSTTAPFTIEADGTIRIDSDSALFQPLELGTESVFTLGSSETIQFSDRPMWVNLTKDEDKLILGLSDGDPTGQAIYIAKQLLHEHGIHRPNATHEDGTPLTVTEDGKGYWIDVPHFSQIILGPSEITALGRQNGNTQTHIGTIVWDTATEELFINVPTKTSTYEVLVETAWFEANMPHLALKNRSWTPETYQGTPYYAITIPAQETPTQLHFMSFRATSNLLYTYGAPEIIQAHAFNATLRAERGPMWITTEIDTLGLEIEITRPGGGPYEVLVDQEWLYGQINEHPLFTEGSKVLAVEAVLNHGWLIDLVDTLRFRIWDSQAGPLVPPRYERVPGGILTHLDGCAIRHLVHIENQTLRHEGPVA